MDLDQGEQVVEVRLELEQAAHVAALALGDQRVVEAAGERGRSPPIGPESCVASCPWFLRLPLQLPETP